MRKIRHYTQAEKLAYVEAFMKQNQSHKSYSKEHGIAESTFRYWVKKYEQEQTESEQESNPGFIPIKIEPEKGIGQVLVTGRLHFLYPNGIQVVCREGIDYDLLKTLLNP